MVWCIHVFRWSFCAAFEKSLQQRKKIEAQCEDKKYGRIRPISSCMLIIESVPLRHVIWRQQPRDRISTVRPFLWNILCNESIGSSVLHVLFYRAWAKHSVAMDAAVAFDQSNVNRGQNSYALMSVGRSYLEQSQSNLVAYDHYSYPREILYMSTIYID